MRRIELDAGWQRTEIVAQSYIGGDAEGVPAGRHSAAFGSNRIGPKPTVVDHCFTTNEMRGDGLKMADSGRLQTTANDPRRSSASTPGAFSCWLGRFEVMAAVIRGLKAQLVGEIEVAAPDLAGSLTDLGLIDEYRLYLHPIVLGRGKPFFAGARPPLRLVTSDLIGEDVIRLTYVPA